MNILVVGGAGYIGSHVCKALKNAGFTPIVYDNLQNGHPWAVKWGPLIHADLFDESTLDRTLQEVHPQAVIHLASSIDVRESMIFPEKYFRNNVLGSVKLFSCMKKHGIDKLVFSSTAAVYGEPQKLPIPESHPCLPINVYGKTKWIVEQIIPRLDFSSVILRYFNAAGADPSGEIGEAHTPETHLIPLAIEAAIKKEPFQLYGTDHPTPDGTPIRDFIHVCDLAQAHVRAVEYLLQGGPSATLNLGSGTGASLLEILSIIEKKLGPVPCHITPRRPSDPPLLIADISSAEKVLQFTPQYDLETILSSAIQWHSNAFSLYNS